MAVPAIAMGRGGDLLKIDPAALTIDAAQNSRRFEPSSERIRDLAENLLAVGQIEPVTIRRVGKDTYTLVSGYTRHRAVSLINSDPALRAHAGLGEGDVFPLLCKVTTCNETEALLESISENLFRNTTSAVDNAHAQRRLRRLGKSESEIAALYKMTPARVSQLSRILELSDAKQRLIHDGQITVANGIALSDLIPDQQDVVLSESGLDVSALEPVGPAEIDWDVVTSSVQPSGNPIVTIGSADSSLDRPTPDVKPAKVDNGLLKKKIAKAQGKGSDRSVAEMKKALREVSEANTDVAIREVTAAMLAWVQGQTELDDVLDTIAQVGAESA